MTRLFDLFVTWWLGRCQHHGEHVTADVLEGQYPEPAVQHCRRCGAVRVVYINTKSDWERPNPVWFPGNGGER